MASLIGGNGAYYTRQLFWEEWILLENAKQVQRPIFTLYRNKPDMINFGKEYIASRDPSGYKVTQKLLNGEYQHWLKLMNANWFLEAKKVWDAELEALLASEAMDKIEALAKDGPPAQQLAAAKYLANKEYKEKKGSTRGRPSKTEVNNELKRQAQETRTLEDDYRRIKTVNL